MKNVEIELDWKLIDWHPDDTWIRKTKPNLLDAGIDIKLIDRTVYVIRVNGLFCIDYPLGLSPTVYVGEGKFENRIDSNRKWAANLMDLVGTATFQVCVATPRVRNNHKAYRDCEATLLHRFQEKFGTLPLWNKQNETKLFDHHQYNNQNLDYVLCRRSGSRYHWAVKPLPSSPFFSPYIKTHVG